MEFEIKQKYNNFIKIIEKKEKVDWLKQNTTQPKNQQYVTTNTNTNTNTNKINKQNSDTCDCEISSGFESVNSTVNNEHEFQFINKPNVNLNQNTNLKSDPNSESNTKFNSETNSMTHVNQQKISYFNQKNDFICNKTELSLLDDDNYIGLNNNNYNPMTNNNSNIENNYKLQSKNDFSNYSESSDDKTINSEFKYLFNNIQLSNCPDKNSISNVKENLEKIFDKVIKKKSLSQSQLQNNKQSSNVQIDIYDLNKIITNENNNINNLLDVLTNFLNKNIFEESTRGWNMENNVFVLNFNILKNVLEKIKYSSKPDIKIGYFYRDFHNSKIYLDSDFTKYWIGNEFNSSENQIKKMNHTIKNKILFYSLKNLVESNKYKKKIGKYNYKFLKKTIQVFGNKGLIIDIVFYVGIKNFI